MSTREEAPLVRAEDVEVHFTKPRGLFARDVIHAVNGVSLRIDAGETVGLVGESGSGKSTLGRALLRLVDPTRGTVHFEGRDITRLGERELRPIRRRMQIVFQDPYGSLNPRMTIGEAIAEPLLVHRIAPNARAARERAAELLAKVGLGADRLDRHPHEFSGGQRQRIVIARALAVEPRFIVCDEPVAALDVSVQAQVVNLLRDLAEELGLAYLFVAHDLSVVRFISQRIAVMYLGRIVELATTDALFESPAHPYTKALLAAVPIADPARARDAASRKLTVLPGEPPSPLTLPRGCAFHPRCPIAERGRCDVETPVLRDVGDGHRVACHLA